jgi:hypothetical protein
MFYRKFTFARVRMLVLTFLMLLAVFGQIAGERKAECSNCQLAVCPGGTGPCWPDRVGCICVVNGAKAICPNNGNREK